MSQKFLGQLDRSLAQVHIHVLNLSHMKVQHSVAGKSHDLNHI